MVTFAVDVSSYSPARAAQIRAKLAELQGREFASLDALEAFLREAKGKS